MPQSWFWEQVIGGGSVGQETKTCLCAMLFCGTLSWAISAEIVML